ncbi:MAG: CIA30 family protein, partial [Bacteroidota bacterium]
HEQTALSLYKKESLPDLFSFNEPTDFQSWLVVNDGVMGGLSSSQFIPGETGVARYCGEVSLENNGGFASVRTMPREFGLSEERGILLRVKGDGRTYQFRLRTSARFDGIAYRQAFLPAKDEWMEIRLPFSDFEPVFRGRILSGVGKIEPAQIRQLGFLIADKQAGDFCLEIDWIKTYQDN